MHNVYIAEIEKIIPEQHTPSFFADKLYPESTYGTGTNKLAVKLAAKIGIEKYASVLDFDAYPTLSLADPKDHPKEWGIEIINRLTRTIAKPEIGYFGLSYNQTMHTDILPNLATQINLAAELTGLEQNEEVSYYGCAGGVMVLRNAIKYCRESGKPAIVFTYDQCTSACHQLDRKDNLFKKSLISNLLFTDAGVGLLIIPESMKSRYNKPLLKIQDSDTRYLAGDHLYMKNGSFMMESDVKDIVPPFVSNKFLKPFLDRNNIKSEDIPEWAIHQGGTEILKQFNKPEVLNLTEKQTGRSFDLFKKYGNTSTASSFLVLESFFNEPKPLENDGQPGVLLAFGAGYYMATVLYHWEMPK